MKNIKMMKKIKKGKYRFPKTGNSKQTNTNDSEKHQTNFKKRTNKNTTSVQNSTQKNMNYRLRSKKLPIFIKKADFLTNNNMLDEEDLDDIVEDIQKFEKSNKPPEAYNQYFFFKKALIQKILTKKLV